MKNVLVVSILASSLVFVTGADAAFSRSYSFHGSRGANYSRSVNCASVSCSWQKSGNTADGRNFQRQGSASCADHSCTEQRSGTTVNGRTWNQQRSGSCVDGDCSWSASGTAPNGASYSRSGSFERDWD